MQPNPLPLRDIHLPEAIAWWPPALGWWLLALLIPLTGFFCYRLYKHLRRKTAIKTAKKILLAIKRDKNQSNLQKLCELSALLRRVAVSVSPRTDVAGLTGQAWLAYLDRSVKDAPFSNGVGRCFGHAPYQKTRPTNGELIELIALCERWLKSQSKQPKLKSAK